MTRAINRWAMGLALFLCAFSGLAATTETELVRISWAPDLSVTWDMFQGAPPPNASYINEAAAIHMTIGWHVTHSLASANGTTWTCQLSSITVTNTMEPALSWAVPGTSDLGLLRHEQLHFDLSEVYRRKLECQLLALGCFTSATQQGAVDLLNEALTQTTDDVLQKLAEMTTLYDSQTAHSHNAAEQARWDALITAWLAAPATAP